MCLSKQGLNRSVVLRGITGAALAATAPIMVMQSAGAAVAAIFVALQGLLVTLLTVGSTAKVLDRGSAPDQVRARNVMACTHEFSPLIAIKSRIGNRTRSQYF